MTDYTCPSCFDPHGLVYWIKDGKPESVFCGHMGCVLSDAEKADLFKSVTFPSTFTPETIKTWSGRLWSQEIFRGKSIKEKLDGIDQS